MKTKGMFRFALAHRLINWRKCSNGTLQQLAAESDFPIEERSLPESGNLLDGIVQAVLGMLDPV